jgi:hypothetical protein
VELNLSRKEFTERSTIGELTIAGQFECFTLEDVVRFGPKVYGETAIPRGRYEVVINWSDRFQRLMPLLLNVPCFDGIRIHSGNTAADTEGCILVGRTKGKDEIRESRLAFGDLYAKLAAALSIGKVFLVISGEPGGADV